MVLLSGLFIFCASQLQAADADEQIIRSKLLQARPDFQISSVKPSPVNGIYEVELGGGPVLYVSADGDFFILGDLFSVGVGGIVNLAEKQRDRARKTLIDSVAREDMVVFAADEETRATVTVFTDVDCFYCQKLHKEVPAMNAKGIEIRYLRVPASGREGVRGWVGCIVMLGPVLSEAEWIGSASP